VRSDRLRAPHSRVMYGQIKVFGVFDSVVTNRWYTGGVDTRAGTVSAKKEVWVCDENGAVEAGDLLCSASTPGYAMKQDVELISSDRTPSQKQR
jgi:hypothetical protein